MIQEEIFIVRQKMYQMIPDKRLKHEDKKEDNA